MNNSMMMRRRIFLESKQRTYVLHPEGDGRIEQAKIPFTAGCHIHMEWDTTKLSARAADSVMSLRGQTGLGPGLINADPALSAYSIIGGNLNKTVYQGGTFDFDPPVDGNLFVGYWTDDDNTDRRITGDYIRIIIMN